MIQANELRIGNWIYDRGGKKWQIDYWENPNKVASKSPLIGTHPIIGEMFGHPFTEELEYLQPIPLTPEILEKCGFISRLSYYKTYKYTNGKCKVMQHESKDGLRFWVVGFHNSRFLFLHQLQNLYWCLCGEELTFKP